MHHEHERREGNARGSDADARVQARYIDESAQGLCEAERAVEKLDGAEH